MSSEPKQTFRIVQEKTASRCEICHQSDLFDLETGVCGRCQPLIQSQLVPRLDWIEDAASPAMIAPAGFQAFRTPGQLTYSHPTLSLRSLRRLAREAFHHYRHNFPVFFSIVALMEFPLAVMTYLLRGFPGVVIVLALVATLLGTIASGALTSAVLDAFPGENVSVNRAYNFIRRRGWRFVYASLLGQVNRWAGFLGGSIAGFFVGAFFSALTQNPWPMAVLAFIGGLWLGGKTYSTAAFVTEIAALEGREFDDALFRSRWLGETNVRALSVVNTIEWGTRLLETLTAFTSFGHNALFLAYLVMVFSLALPGKLAGQELWIFLPFVFFKTLWLPFWGTLKTLLYLYLRRQAEGAEFAFRFTSEPEENP
ncbi:MAG: hypothetical protein K1Y36_05160 [Blastocatellia bacterium]|nr:hypothetical protein [Blastocatellia bacterium]